MSVFDRVVRWLKGRRCASGGDVVSYPHAVTTDHIAHDKRNYGGGVHPFSAGSEQAALDLGCVRVLAEALSAELLRTVQHGERASVRGTSAALIAAAKRCGLYIPYSDRAQYGDLKRRRSGESEIYAGPDYAYLVKFKDPEAKQPIKRTQPTDWLFEHVVHNVLFPDTRYEFMGVSEVAGSVRIVLKQGNVSAVSFPTEEMVAEELKGLGLSPEDRYHYGNAWLSVTDVGAQGDNVLLGDDGHLYFIDPLIRLKRPALVVLKGLVAESEVVSRLFEMYAKLTGNGQRKELARKLLGLRYNTADARGRFNFAAHDADNRPNVELINRVEP